MNTITPQTERIVPDPATGDLRRGSRSNLIHVKSILVPVDFSELSLKSLQYAVPLAQQFDAKVTLLYVVEPLSYVPEFPTWMVVPPDSAIEIRKELDALRKARIPEDVTVDIAVYDNFVPSAVVEAARTTCADLIVITTHGRTGLGRWLEGSDSEKIVRVAPCPVLVLRDPERDFV